MADLEDMLLEAAGRTGTSGLKDQSHLHAGWNQEDYCSDGSDSIDDDSRFSRGKHPGPHIPLKKRFELPQKDKETNGIGGNTDCDEFDNFSGEDSDSIPSVGSDLFKDDKDKEELGKMTELDREMILAERSMKRDDYQLKKKARKSSSKANYASKESPPPHLSNSHVSLRLDKASSKSDALNELRAKRLKQQEPKACDKFMDLATGGTSGIFDAEVSSDDSGSNTDGSENKLQGDKYLEENVDDLMTSDSEPLCFKDVKEITIQRSKLVKWLMEPFFEDTIIGCFVRIGVAHSHSGPKYRLCLVQSVDASNPDQRYKVDGRTTYKWLICRWGNESLPTRCQIAVVSDSPPLSREFDEWVAEVHLTGGKMPKRHDMKNKKAKINEIGHFVYSAATVKQMLEEKKSTSTRPRNVAAEKDRLRKEIETAVIRGDSSEAENLQAKLKELVELSQSKQVDAKAVRLAEINRKNRVENFRNASERKPLNTCLKAGEEGYDPFSRRWTRSRNYYLSKTVADGAALDVGNASSIASLGDAKDSQTADGDESGMAAALEAAADSGKLVDTKAPVDRGTVSNLLHYFELPISLAGLQSFGGPRGMAQGFMARKQKIEATVGCKVPENDGKRHSLTLTVSDYKRRRGLL